MKTADLPNQTAWELIYTTGGIKGITAILAAPHDKAPRDGIIEGFPSAQRLDNYNHPPEVWRAYFLTVLKHAVKVLEEDRP